MSDARLRGRVVLVTGGNNPHGIGAATAKAFAAEGARVLVHFFRGHYARHRTPDDGERSDPTRFGEAFYLAQQTKTADAVVGVIRGAGGEADAWEGDLADPATVPALFDWAEGTYGPVEVLVNNAAYSEPDTFIPHGLLEDHDRAGGGTVPAPTTAEIVDRHFAVNTRAVALMMAEFARRHVARAASWGRIINVSTDAADHFGSQVSYGASKHALESYSRSAAGELGRYGITVNVVAPGPIQTGYMPPEVVAREERRTPLGRVGRPDDVADVIVFLASEQGRWLSGQLLYVGGGHKMPI